MRHFPQDVNIPHFLHPPFQNFEEFSRKFQVLFTPAALPKSQDICAWIIFLKLFNDIVSDALVESSEGEPLSRSNDCSLLIGVSCWTAFRLGNGLPAVNMAFNGLTFR